MLKKVLGLSGYQISRRTSRPPRQYPFGRFLRPDPVVFDVGANEGQSIERFLAEFPRCTIHAFEPDPECFGRLRGRYGDQIHLNNVGLGNTEGELPFFRFQNTGSNSFSPPNQSSGYALNSVFAGQREDRASITTLDRYVAERRIEFIDLLKTDTQGFDYDVLLGARDCIEQGAIGVIYSEVILVDLYAKRASLKDFELLLEQYRYSLYSLNELNYSLDGRLTHFNVTFVSDRLLARNGPGPNEVHA